MPVVGQLFFFVRLDGDRVILIIIGTGSGKGHHRSQPQHFVCSVDYQRGSPGIYNYNNRAHLLDLNSVVRAIASH